MSGGHTLTPASFIQAASCLNAVSLAEVDSRYKSRLKQKPSTHSSCRHLLLIARKFALLSNKKPLSILMQDTMNCRHLSLRRRKGEQICHLIFLPPFPKQGNGLPCSYLHPGWLLVTGTFPIPRLEKSQTSYMWTQASTCSRGEDQVKKNVSASAHFGYIPCPSGAGCFLFIDPLPPSCHCHLWHPHLLSPCE